MRPPAKAAQPAPVVELPRGTFRRRARELWPTLTEEGREIAFRATPEGRTLWARVQEKEAEERRSNAPRSSGLPTP